MGSMESTFWAKEAAFMHLKNIRHLLHTSRSVFMSLNFARGARETIVFLWLSDISLLLRVL
jgi:hypothetical protein